jgi:uncharacterized protein with von Willebrand factor type A (vWA) domain
MSPDDSARMLPGHLAENVMHFARVLRSAGLPVGSDRIQTAILALEAGGLESRTDFRAALSSCFVSRHEHQLVFDQAFHIFWRDPDLLGRVMSMLLPRVQGRPQAPPPPENRRLGDALFPQQPKDRPPPPEEEKLETEATLTFSDREVLRKQDFETMTAAEWDEARRMLARMTPLFERLRTRRHRTAHRPGRPDWRATIAGMARHGGALQMQWQQPRTRPAPLVVLADISGSMSRYSRMLLHFVHALSQADVKVSSFVFGTRLTHITRTLRLRDPDAAIAGVSAAVPDWSGGTRISECLHRFNHDWARRVLGGSATVLLISDGLEHGSTEALSHEMERLHKSCRRLVWLNPLLRFDRFEPRAGGIKAMLPHVDEFRAAHNIESLAELAEALSRPPEQRRNPSALEA